MTLLNEFEKAFDLENIILRNPHYSALWAVKWFADKVIEDGIPLGRINIDRIRQLASQLEKK